MTCSLLSKQARMVRLRHQIVGPLLDHPKWHCTWYQTKGKTTERMERQHQRVDGSRASGHPDGGARQTVLEPANTLFRQGISEGDIIYIQTQLEYTTLYLFPQYHTLYFTFRYPSLRYMLPRCDLVLYNRRNMMIDKHILPCPSIAHINIFMTLDTPRSCLQ